MDVYIILTLVRLFLSLLGYGAMRLTKYFKYEDVSNMHQYRGCNSICSRASIVFHSAGLFVHMACMSISLVISLYLLVDKLMSNYVPNANDTTISYRLEWIQLMGYYISTPLMLVVYSFALLGYFDYHRLFARFTLPTWILTTLVTLAFELYGSDVESDELETLRAIWIVALVISAISAIYVVYNCFLIVRQKRQSQVRAIN